MNAFEQQAIPDAETLPLTYLPDRPSQLMNQINSSNEMLIKAHTNHQSPIMVTNSQLTCIPELVEPTEAEKQITWSNILTTKDDRKDFRTSRSK